MSKKDLTGFYSNNELSELVKLVNERLKTSNSDQQIPLHISLYRVGYPRQLYGVISVPNDERWRRKFDDQRPIDDKKYSSYFLNREEFASFIKDILSKGNISGTVNTVYVTSKMVDDDYETEEMIYEFGVGSLDYILNLEEKEKKKGRKKASQPSESYVIVTDEIASIEEDNPNEITSGYAFLDEFPEIIKDAVAKRKLSGTSNAKYIYSRPYSVSQKKGFQSKLKKKKNAPRELPSLVSRLFVTEGKVAVQEPISDSSFHKKRIEKIGDQELPEYFADRLKNLITSTLNSASRITELDELTDMFYEKILSQKKVSHEHAEILYRHLTQLKYLTLSSVSYLKPSLNGFTSTSSFTLDDKFIKMDNAKRINIEQANYQRIFREFNQFRPTLITSVTSDDYGIMALSNIQKELPGFIKANNLFQTSFKGHDLNYHLFLMGLFHKETQQHLNEFDQAIYKGIHGEPHFEEALIPSASQSGSAYERFKETAIDPQKVASIINNYRTYQEKLGNTIIHGDWKKANVPNGHLVDYTQMGRGFAIDELAYFLSDEEFRTTKEGFHQCINNYAELRLTHDNAFFPTTQTQMHQLADSSLLTQLVLRHAVMNKRDMNDQEKYNQRLFYQHTINKLLKAGTFI